MADLAATNVAVTVNSRDREVAGAAAGKNMTLATIVFGDGSLQYRTGGVPMPDKSKFGFHKIIDFVSVEQPVANGFVYKFDRTNNKLKIFTQGFTTGGTAAGGEAETGALANNSLGAEGAVRMIKTVASTTYDMGGMIEMPDTTAIAAATVKLLMIGE